MASPRIAGPVFLVVASTAVVVLGVTLLLPFLGALYLLPLPLVLALARRGPAAVASLLGLPLGWGVLWLLAVVG
jgi:hypothetical protein